MQQIKEFNIAQSLTNMPQACLSPVFAIAMILKQPDGGERQSNHIIHC